MSLSVCLLAGLAVVGAGFSTWYFTEGASTEKAASVFVSGYANICDLTVSPDALKLKLDQGEGDDSGIHLVKEDESTISDTIDVGYKIEDDDSYTITIPTEKTAAFTTKVTVPTALDFYFSIQVQTDSYNAHSLTGGDTATTTGSTIYTVTDTLNNLSITDSGKIQSKFSFAWNADNKPTDVKSWGTLKELLTPENFLRIEYSLEW